MFTTKRGKLLLNVTPHHVSSIHYCNQDTLKIVPQMQLQPDIGLSIETGDLCCHSDPIDTVTLPSRRALKHTFNLA